MGMVVLAMAPWDVARAQPADTAKPAADDGREPVTLGEVRAIRPEDEEPLRDPFAPPPNTFAKRFRNPPTPEQIALDYHGYIMYGITKGVIHGGRWLNKATGGPDQIQGAAARPPPLDDEQWARAARWVEDAPAQPPGDHQATP